MIKVTKPKQYVVVGCGGVASYFLPTFFKTLNYINDKKSPPVLLIDGDDIEEKNRIRQNFECFDGSKKVEILSAMYSKVYSNGRININDMYFSDGDIIEEDSCAFCFADNHLARKHVLESVDESPGSMAIIAANSEISAHSYVYLHGWAGTPVDPRVMYPEINTDTTDSPIRTGGCDTEKAMSEVPQTAIANTMAASCALLAWNLWCLSVPDFGEMQEENFEKLPFMFFNTSVDMGRKTIKQEKENANKN
jgi:hypothetical protein